jgi:hypothetical protein
MEDKDLMKPRSTTEVVLHLRSMTDTCDVGEIFKQAVEYGNLSLFGSHHHTLVTAVLLTAYRNAGAEFDYDLAIAEGMLRGQNAPLGACGYFGVCGAAMGAGVFLSIITETNPMTTGKQYVRPMELVRRCLGEMVQFEGPRCCKRSSFIVLEATCDYVVKEFGVPMECTSLACAYSAENPDCLFSDCPYFAPRRR